MKKKVLTVLGAVLMLLSGLSITAYAAETELVKTVVFTSENEIKYIDGSTNLEEAFLGMAPGESRTTAIKVENQNSHTTSFYISGETTKALEEINESAKGGAYEVQLAIGKELESATALLESIAGGYSSDSVASEEGLKAMTELEGYQYLAELDENQYTNIYLTIALEGEGMDSTNTVDYSNAIGSLAFHFQAYYEEDEQKPTENEEGEKGKETDTIEKNVSRTKIVKTGDTLPVVGLLVVLAVGITLVVVAVKRGKAEKS